MPDIRKHHLYFRAAAVFPVLMDAANLLPTGSGRLVFDPYPGGGTWCLAAAPLAAPPPKHAIFSAGDATTMVANTVESRTPTSP